MFPNEDIHMNYSHPSIIYDSTRRLVVLDIYIPQLHLVFEAQGAQHYHWSYRSGDPKDQQVCIPFSPSSLPFFSSIDSLLFVNCYPLGS